MKNSDIHESMSSNDFGSRFVYGYSPRTHFFYEYDEERAVDPLLLVNNGISLWHEEMADYTKQDLSHLWGFAEALLSNRNNNPTLYSSFVEGLRYRITIGEISPPGWDLKEPYPYNGLLISAIYLQEAYRICTEEPAHHDRAWHLITIAFYHIGLNTQSSMDREAAVKNKKRHAEYNLFKHAVALNALETIKGDSSVKSINQAIDKIIEFVESNPKIEATLKEIDKLQPSKRKKRGDSALDRFAALLRVWASPSGHNQEIYEALTRFNHRKTKARTKTTPTTSANIEWEAPPNGALHYMRIINWLANGAQLTITLSKEEDDEVPEFLKALLKQEDRAAPASPT